MLERIEELLKEVETFRAESKEQLEQFRIKMLGTKGEIKALFNAFKEVDNALKKEVGQSLNTLKVKAEEKVQILKGELESAHSQVASTIDLSLPSGQTPIGSRHPISLMRNRICEIFQHIGFSVAEGPEIEDDFHNFSALNFP